MRQILSETVNFRTFQRWKTWSKRLILNNTHGYVYPKESSHLPGVTYEVLMVCRKVRHKNVVQFIGACTKPPNLCIVTGTYIFISFHLSSGRSDFLSILPLTALLSYWKKTEMLLLLVIMCEDDVHIELHIFFASSIGGTQHKRRWVQFDSLSFLCWSYPDLEEKLCMQSSCHVEVCMIISTSKRLF